MRELDAVLQSFLSSAADLDDADLSAFEAILDLPDPVLFAYLTGRSAPEDPKTAQIIERIRSRHRTDA